MRAADVLARQAAAMSEDELAATVAALADVYGLWAFHDNDSRRNRAGLPDWLLVGSRVLWRELKSEKGRLRRSQADVLARLAAAGEDAAVWRPSDLLSGQVAAQIRAVSPRTREAVRAHVTAAGEDPSVWRPSRFLPGEIPAPTSDTPTRRSTP